MTPDIPADLAWFRYLLVVLAAVWALLLARGRPIVGLIAGCLFVTIAIGFWALAFGRPYGLFEDPGITRRAAEIGVRAWASPGEGILSATSPASDRWASLAGAGVSPRVLIRLPTALPLLIVPAIAVLIHVFWPARRHSAWAAVSWLAFSTGDLDALRGVGVVSGMWARPGAALAVLMSVAAIFALGRWSRFRTAWMPIATLLALMWWWGTASADGLGAGSALLALTLDQGLWLPLGWFGLFRRAETTSRALALAGAIVVLLSALPAVAADAWAGHALYRVALLLAAAAPLAEICSALGDRLSRRLRFGSVPPGRLGAAALVAALVPGSFLVWWDPSRLDVVAAGSLPRVRPEVVAAVEWIRANTPPGAVIVASPAHAPAVAALGGRRVLRAPTLTLTEDDADRRQAEVRLLYGHVANRLVKRYGVSHVLLAPGDFGEYWLGVETMESRGPFRLVYRDGDSVFVYAVPR